MPAVHPPALILVTGASGFIAAHVCQQLLQRGFIVRGTVRSESKGEYLKRLFVDYGDKFTFVIVPDIEAPGAFDEAVKGVDAVEHTASPFHGRAKDPQELIGPAVQGTVGVLKSIQKNNPGVKRVVITSSVASVMHPREPPSTYTEVDWNYYSPQVVEKEGKNAPPMDMYRASKVLAEKSAWEFKDKEGAKWDLVTVCPPMVFGPIIHEVPNEASINTSVAAVHSAFTEKGKKEGADAGMAGGNWVDVRDVAWVHCEVLEKEEAANQRYITSAGPYSWQAIYDAFHRAPNTSDLPVESYPKGTPGSDKDTKHHTHSGAKATKELGITFRTMEESIPDTLRALRAKGF